MVERGKHLVSVAFKNQGCLARLDPAAEANDRGNWNSWKFDSPFVAFWWNLSALRKERKKKKAIFQTNHNIDSQRSMFVGVWECCLMK
jgi:hypothetical protein